MKHTWKFCNVSPSKRLKSRDFLISLRDSDCALHLVFLSFITGHSFSKAYHSCRRFVLIFHRFSPHSIMYVCFVCIDYSIGGNTGLFLFYLSNHPTLYTNLSLFCLFVYFLLHNLHCKHWFFFRLKKNWSRAYCVLRYLHVDILLVDSLIHSRDIFSWHNDSKYLAHYHWHSSTYKNTHLLSTGAHVHWFATNVHWLVTSALFFDSPFLAEIFDE